MRCYWAPGVPNIDRNRGEYSSSRPLQFYCGVRRLGTRYNRRLSGQMSLPGRWWKRKKNPAGNYVIWVVLYDLIGSIGLWRWHINITIPNSGHYPSSFLLFKTAQLYCNPRVEAGKNTSTVIPESHKRRRKANPVVSDEAVMYGYESSTTLTTVKLHYKLQTCPVVRESPCGGGQEYFHRNPCES
jgi:hypothetical protein